MTVILRCPACKREIAYSQDNPFRPFCSERCRLVDLGSWLAEDYSISSAGPPDVDDTLQEPGSGTYAA